MSFESPYPAARAARRPRRDRARDPRRAPPRPLPGRLHEPGRAAEVAPARRGRSKAARAARAPPARARLRRRRDRAAARHASRSPTRTRRSSCSSTSPARCARTTSSRRRLDAAVDAMTHVPATSCRSQFRVGLVAFSSDAAAAVTPTADRDEIQQVDRLLEPEAGTAVGDGVASAVHMLTTSLHAERVRAQAGPAGPGRDRPPLRRRPEPGDPPARCRPRTWRRQPGIRIYPVSLGTPNGTVTFGFGAVHELRSRCRPTRRR